MKKTIAILFTCLLFGKYIYAQPNLLGVWSVSVPLSYINWYDNGTYSIDTTDIWQSYHQHLVSALGYNENNDLIFQSNACKIANKQGYTILNGDSLVDALFYDNVGSVGSSLSQSVIALPRTATTWWVFNYSFSDSAWAAYLSGNPTVFSSDRLYAAIVDVSDTPKVIQKKIPVYKGVMGDCRMTAVRHANGRDWWLVNHQWNNNRLNKWLVTPDSIYGPFIDSSGTLHKEPDIDGMAQFTLDGTKYGMGSENGLVNILDFDRCSGEFSNLKTINVIPSPPYTDRKSVV